MSFSAAHMAELGLTRWRLRGTEPERPEDSVQPVLSGSEVSQTREPAARDAAAERPQIGSSPPATMLEPAQSKSQQPHIDLEQRRAALSTLGWEELEAHLRQQPIREGASQAVFGVGVHDARLMVIGEAPGADEDRQGQPFVGRAGQLLDQMLSSIGLSRNRDVYIANICKFHPPANRDPHADEIAQDLPYLLRQIELLQPQLLLAVGRIAAQTLLQAEVPVGRLRQQEHVFGEQKWPLIVTYHPAYLLRQPREKAKVWTDLKRARAVLLSHDG